MHIARLTPQLKNIVKYGDRNQIELAVELAIKQGDLIPTMFDSQDDIIRMTKNAVHRS